MATVEDFNPELDGDPEQFFPEDYESDDSATGEKREAALPEGDQEQPWGAVHPGLFNKLTEEGTLPAEEVN